jgi:CheY-like chemotaxis protein
VTLAANGDEALAALATHASFDAMATDYVMPGINGLALIQAAQRLRPGLRCLLVTGHAELDVNDAIGPENIVRKPFNVATLEERVEQLLTRPVLRSVQGGLATAGD